MDEGLRAGPIDLLLLGAGFDGSEQRVIGKVRVPLSALVARMTQDAANGEQVDTAVDHERGRRVPQVMKAYVR